jgi:hypothetical protein
MKPSLWYWGGVNTTDLFIAPRGFVGGHGQMRMWSTYHDVKKHSLHVGWRSHRIFKNYWPNLLVVCIFPDLSCLYQIIWPNFVGPLIFPQKLIVVGLGNLRCQYQEVSILALIVGVNSLTTMVAEMRPLFFELRDRLITFLLFVRWQCLIARIDRELFSSNPGVSHLNEACRIDELSRGSVLGYEILTNN